MSDSEKLKSIIQKCSHCFRKNAGVDGCLLLKERHAGVELCLGPFENQEDRMKKLREDFEREKKPKADLDKAVREVVLKNYLRNKKLFDD